MWLLGSSGRNNTAVHFFVPGGQRAQRERAAAATASAFFSLWQNVGTRPAPRRKCGHGRSFFVRKETLSGSSKSN